MPNKQYFQVHYEWTECGTERHAHTVVSDYSQAEANAKFQRQNQHVRVVRHRIYPLSESAPIRAIRG
jgi:hypothetical protein